MEERKRNTQNQNYGVSINEERNQLQIMAVIDRATNSGGRKWITKKKKEEKRRKKGKEEELNMNYSFVTVWVKHCNVKCICFFERERERKERKVGRRRMKWMNECIIMYLNLIYYDLLMIFIVYTPTHHNYYYY